MAMLTVRNIPDEVHRALRVRAARHGRSMEAEVRAILEGAVQPPQRTRLGDELAALGRTLGLSDADLQELERQRDKSPAEPVRLE